MCDLLISQVDGLHPELDGKVFAVMAANPVTEALLSCLAKVLARWGNCQTQCYRQEQSNRVDVWTEDGRYGIAVIWHDQTMFVSGIIFKDDLRVFMFSLEDELRKVIEPT